jgi:DNA-binding response OmpR family regulator
MPTGGYWRKCVTATTQPNEIPAESPIPPILIVDDNPAIGRSLAKVLQFENYQTVVTLRGLEAIDYARGNRYAAVFVDVHLPDLNGLVVSQKLREILGPDTPIIIVSGDTSMEVINALPHVGATYFLSKPLNVPHVLERLKEWINPPSASA